METEDLILKRGKKKCKVDSEERTPKDHKKRSAQLSTNS